MPDELTSRGEGIGLAEVPALSEVSVVLQSDEGLPVAAEHVGHLCCLNPVRHVPTCPNWHSLPKAVRVRMSHPLLC